jgi:hypothetical protein
MTKPAKSAGSPAAPLDQAARDLLKGVVFDANVFGEGRPDLAALAAMAKRLKAVGLAAWVPEPVAWEWAEHLAADVEKHRTDSAAVLKRLKRAKLPQGSVNVPFPNKAATVAAFLDELSSIAEVTVLPLTGKAAVAAVRDQILQTGAGTTVRGVKTGAADSAWLRLALDEAGGSDAVLVVTNNRKDIYAHCDEVGINPPPMRDFRNLPLAVFTFVAATPAVTQLVHSFLTTTLPGVSMYANGGDDGLGLRLGPVDLDPLRVPGLEDFIPESADIADVVDLVAVADVYTQVTSTIADGEQDLPTSASVEATVYLIADLDSTGYELDNDGRVVPSSWAFPSSLVVAPVSVEIVDGVVVGVTAAGTAHGHVEEVAAFRDAAEALEDALGALALIQGLDLPDGWPHQGGPDPEVPSSAGLVSLLLHGDVNHEWSISISVGALDVKIRCRHDGTARVWDSEGDFDAFPPYTLSSSVNGTRERPGPYPAVAALSALFNGAGTPG